MPIGIATVHDAQSAEYVKALAMREKDRERALVLWRRARSLQPNSATLLGHEALTLLDLKRPDDVIELLAPVLPDHPRHVHLANLLGVALFDRGHYAEARRLFAHCLDLDPEYPPARESIENARRAERKGGGRPAPRAVRDAVERTLAAARSRRRPTLAVCMIVKDEAEFVAGAIESVQGVADEVIVVDTGSTDDTVEIARRAGARVEFFPWTGDFAAARNASIEYATADWILCLDADERLSPASRSTLRSVLEETDEPHRIVCPKIRNYTRDGRFMSDGFSGRLFRNLPEMRFSGRVHEEVGVGVPDVSMDYRLDLVLDHFGADPDVMREKGKDARNIALLEARLAEKPDDLLTWFYLGSQHWVAGRRDEAGRAFERVVELFERNPSRYGLAIRQVPVPYSYVGRVRCLVNAGRGDEAVEVGDRGLTRWPDNPDLWFQVAHAHIARGDFAAARRCLERCLAIEISGYALIGMHDPAIEAWKAEKVLADLDYEEGDHAAAYPRYGRVVDRMPPDSPETYSVAARLVEIACEIGDVAHVAEHTRRYLTLRPGEHGVALQVAAWLQDRSGLQAAYDLLTGLYEDVPALRDVPAVARAIGAIAEQAGEDAEALRWYERVVELGSTDPAFWAGLSRLLLRLDQHQAAAEALQVARRYLAGAGAG